MVPHSDAKRIEVTLKVVKMVVGGLTVSNCC